MKIALPALSFRTLFWGALGLVILLGLLWAFRPRPVLVDVARVSQGELVVTVQDEGRARVREVFVVSAPAGGRLLRVEREVGDHVAPGDVVARVLPPASGPLDVRSAEEAAAAAGAAEAGLAAAASRVRQAQADYALAATEAARVEQLAAEGFATLAARDRVRRDLDAARAALSAAQSEQSARDAELAAARARIAPPRQANGVPAVLEVTAPAGGAVLRIMQESETVVGPGTPLMEIGDPRDLEIVAEFLSSEAARIANGAPASIRDWGGAPDPLPGRVRLVEPYGFTKISALGVEEQRVNVIIDLLDPAAAANAGLGHGWRVDAAVEVARSEDAMLAPVSALFRIDSGWGMFRVRGGRARLTPVEIGQNDGVVTEILSGLEPGDTLVLYPGEQISDRTRIRPRGGG